MANLIERFYKVTLSNDKTKKLLGDILRKAFDEADSAEKSEDILGLAWKFQVPQFDDMLTDHSNNNYRHF